MAGFLRRFLAPAEDPRGAFPEPIELRARMAELDGQARRALAAGDRFGAWEAVFLYELAAAELDELEGETRVSGAVDTFAVELHLASLEWELRDPSRQPPPGG